MGKERPADPHFAHLQGHLLLTCPDCAQDFKLHSDWRSHLDKKHKYKSKPPKSMNFYLDKSSNSCYICTTCDQLIIRNKPISILMLHLQYHYFKHARFPNIYKCLRCQKSYPRKRLLCEHLCTEHPITLNLIPGMRAFHNRMMLENRSYYQLNNSTTEKRESNAKTINNSEIATSQGTSPTASDARTMAHSNSEFYILHVCPKCEKMFASHNKWNLHLESSHSTLFDISNLEISKIPAIGKYFCLICRGHLETRDPHQLVRHYLEHLPSYFPYQCALCCLRTKYKSDLLVHFIKNHLNIYLRYRDEIVQPIELGTGSCDKTKAELKYLLQQDSEQLLQQQKQREMQNGKVNRRLEKGTHKPDLIEKALKASAIDFSTDDEKPNEDSALDRKWRNSPKAMSPNAKVDDYFLELEVLPKPDSHIGGCDDGSHNEDSRVFKKPFPVIPFKSPKAQPKPAAEILSLEIEPLVTKRLAPQTSFGGGISLSSLTSRSPHFREPTAAAISSERLHGSTQSYIEYLCIECARPFKSKALLNIHMRKQHNPRETIVRHFELRTGKKQFYRCLKCNEIIPKAAGQKQVFRHYTRHLTNKAYLRCVLCGERKSKEKHIHQHLMTVHEITPPQSADLKAKASENKTHESDTDDNDDDDQEAGQSKTLSIHKARLDADNHKTTGQSGYQPFQLRDDVYKHCMAHFRKARQRYDYLVNNVDNEDFFVNCPENPSTNKNMNKILFE